MINQIEELSFLPFAICQHKVLGASDMVVIWTKLQERAGSGGKVDGDPGGQIDAHQEENGGEKGRWMQAHEGQEGKWEGLI